MKPGTMVLPARFTVVAPAGSFIVLDGPTAATRPFATTSIACSIGARPVPSISRAPLKTTAPTMGGWALDEARVSAARTSDKPKDGARRPEIRRISVLHVLFRLQASGCRPGDPTHLRSATAL